MAISVCIGCLSVSAGTPTATGIPAVAGCSTALSVCCGTTAMSIALLAAASCASRSAASAIARCILSSSAILRASAASAARCASSARSRASSSAALFASAASATRLASSASRLASSAALFSAASLSIWMRSRSSSCSSHRARGAPQPSGCSISYTKFGPAFSCTDAPSICSGRVKRLAAA